MERFAAVLGLLCRLLPFYLGLRNQRVCVYGKINLGRWRKRRRWVVFKSCLRNVLVNRRTDLVYVRDMMLVEVSRVGREGEAMRRCAMPRLVAIMTEIEGALWQVAVS